MGIMYYIYIWKYDNDTTKHGWVFPPPSPKTTVIYSASIHMLCTCWCACVHVCVSVHVCVGLSGAHTQIENMFGSPFGMFSLSFPHLMLLICMQQVCRWRHLDANTHAHTHKSIHGHIRTGHTQIHTCKAHAHTHTPKQAHAHSHSHGECPVLIRIWRNFENHCKYFGDYCI